MKEKLLLVAVLLLCLCVSSCGKDKEPPQQTDSNDMDTEPAITETEQENDEKMNTSEPAEEQIQEENSIIPTAEMQELGDKASKTTGLTYNTETGSKLDIYFPAQDLIPEGGAQAVLYIHGGTWIEGSRSSFPGSVKKLCNDHGYVLFSVDYRFISKTRHCQDLLDEIATSVEFIAKNAEAFHINPDLGLGVLGHSAGGHLSLMYAYTVESQIPVKAVCGLAPPASLECSEEQLIAYSKANPNIMNVCGWLSGKEIVDNDISVMDEVLPITYVTADIVPTVLVTGARDTTVPAPFTDAFAAKLNAAGAEWKSFLLPNSNHDLASDSALLMESLEAFAGYLGY